MKSGVGNGRIFNFKMAVVARSFLLLFVIWAGAFAKLSDNKTNGGSEAKTLHKISMQNSAGAGFLLSEELKQLLDRYLFGICPQGYKSQFSNRGKNETSACEVDSQHELAGRLASLSIRAQMAGRGDAARALSGLASVFADLARTAVQQGVGGPSSESTKKRKLSKSQKSKLQAKQRTALAVKKKAAAAAAAAAAKMAS